MQKFLKQLQTKKCWKSFLKASCRQNKVDPCIVNYFTIAKIRKFFEKLSNVEIKNQKRVKSSVWLQNQLKAFHWMLVVVSGISQLTISKFEKNEWIQFEEMFHKNAIIFEYQALILINQGKTNKVKWSEEESSILEKIIHENLEHNKWNEIARKLFQFSERKFFRSGKQCRERWFNHLDPHKKHGEWDQEEDRAIAEFILDYGKKWAEISKRLSNIRTEHMIKNRYKTLMIKLKKANKGVQVEEELLKIFLDKKVVVKRQYIHSEQQMQQQKPRPQKSKISDFSELRDLAQNFQINHNHNNNEVEFHQVLTPCPMIYQSFTPNFLNTPHSVPFLMNYSFQRFEERDNLFIKK